MKEQITSYMHNNKKNDYFVEDESSVYLNDIPYTCPLKFKNIEGKCSEEDSDINDLANLNLNNDYQESLLNEKIEECVNSISDQGEEFIDNNISLFEIDIDLNSNNEEVNEHHSFSRETVESNSKKEVYGKTYQGNDNSLEKDDPETEYKINKNAIKSKNTRSQIFENEENYDKYSNYQDLNKISNEKFSYSVLMNQLVNANRIDITFFNLHLKNRIIKIITNKELSTYLQSQIEKTDDNVFYTALLEIYPSFHLLMKQSYSNYYCQILFDKSCTVHKIKILKILLDNVDSIVNSEVYLRSVTSILEDTNEDECQREVSLKMSKINQNKLFNKFYLRLLEPIISFKSEYCAFLVDFIINNFKKLLSTRQGYFLIKKLVQTTKDLNTQSKIVDKMISLPFKLYNDINGSLLAQCAIMNFQLKKENDLYIDNYRAYINKFNNTKNEKHLSDPVFFKKYYEYYLPKSVDNSDKQEPILVTIKDEFKENSSPKQLDYFKNKTLDRNKKLYHQVYLLENDNLAFVKLISYFVEEFFIKTLNKYSFKLVLAIIRYGGIRFQEIFLKKINQCKLEKLKKGNLFIYDILTNSKGSKLLSECIDRFTIKNNFKLKPILKYFKNLLEGKLPKIANQIIDFDKKDEKKIKENNKKTLKKINFLLTNSKENDYTAEGDEDFKMLTVPCKYRDDNLLNSLELLDNKFLVNNNNSLDCIINYDNNKDLLESKKSNLNKVKKAKKGKKTVSKTISTRNITEPQLTKDNPNNIININPNYNINPHYNVVNSKLTHNKDFKEVNKLLIPYYESTQYAPTYFHNNPNLGNLNENNLFEKSVQYTSSPQYLIYAPLNYPQNVSSPMLITANQQLNSFSNNVLLNSFDNINMMNNINKASILPIHTNNLNLLNYGNNHINNYNYHNSTLTYNGLNSFNNTANNGNKMLNNNYYLNSSDANSTKSIPYSNYSSNQLSQHSYTAPTQSNNMNSYFDPLSQTSNSNLLKFSKQKESKKENIKKL